MSYRPHTSSRRSTDRGHGKVRREKAKHKGQKHSSGGKYLLEESKAPNFEEIVEKTVCRLQSLGGQTFAFSPFSHYYDDWLFSLKSVLSEFESNPAVNVDEEFEKERAQVIAGIELELAKRRREETVLEETARKLAYQKNLLVQTDAEYTHKIQKLASQRNREIKRLTNNVNDIEEELEEARQTKVSIFSPFARKAKSQKTAEISQKLDDAKREHESAVKAFDREEEKIHDEYEKRKQAVTAQVRILEKKVEGSETDDSVEDRRFACEDLVNALKALLQRNPSLG